MTACLSSSVPSPVAPEISNTGPFHRSRRTISLARRAASLGLEQIDLVDHQPALLGGEFGCEFLEFADDGTCALDGVGRPDPAARYR